MFPLSSRNSEYLEPITTLPCHTYLFDKHFCHQVGLEPKTEVYRVSLNFLNCSMFSLLSFNSSYKGSLTRNFYSKLYSLAHLQSYYKCFLCSKWIYTFYFDYNFAKRCLSYLVQAADHICWTYTGKTPLSFDYGISHVFL